MRREDSARHESAPLLKKGVREIERGETGR
jgi:hypothetical protein